MSYRGDLETFRAWGRAVAQAIAEYAEAKRAAEHAAQDLSKNLANGLHIFYREDNARLEAELRPFVLELDPQLREEALEHLREAVRLARENYPPRMPW